MVIHIVALSTQSKGGDIWVHSLLRCKQIVPKREYCRGEKNTSKIKSWSLVCISLSTKTFVTKTYKLYFIANTIHTGVHSLLSVPWMVLSWWYQMSHLLLSRGRNWCTTQTLPCWISTKGIDYVDYGSVLSSFPLWPIRELDRLEKLLEGSWIAGSIMSFGLIAIPF